MQSRRRFGKIISVMERSENMTQVFYEYLTDECYELFYKKLDRIIDAFLLSGSEEKLCCRIEFLTQDYISMLCQAGRAVVALNYDLTKECFESDKTVLKRENCKKKEIKASLKNIDRKMPRSPFAVLRISCGVALYFDREAPVRVKIRHDNTKKLIFS